MRIGLKIKIKGLFKISERSLSLPPKIWGNRITHDATQVM